MKKILSIFIWIILISNILYAHRQHVHQRLAVEGYYLLKKWLGVSDIPIMIDRLGGLSSYYIGTNPWEKGYITTGEWREDVEDVIYNYSIENHPTVSGFTFSMITALGQALGGSDNNDGFISSTHFWYADNGDAIATDMYGSVEILGVPNTFQFTIPNAYQKIMLYANGNFDLRIQLIIRDFPNSNGTPCAEQWAWVNFRYGYLPSYFNSKVLRVSKIEWLDGSTTNYPNLPVFQDYHYALTNAISYNNFKNNICWEILGRMCHLLQDVGSPAHANIDPHGGSGLRYDSFESYFGEIGWTADMVYNQNPTMLDPYISSNPIHFLMYTTQQQANHFAANGPHMNQNNNSFGGNALPEEVNYLNALNISNYGLPITMQENIPSEQLNNMRDKLIPQIIRATAGLLYWFAAETGLVNRVTLKNNFSAGTLKFNQETLQSGGVKTLLSGDNHVLTAIPQSYNNYAYIWSTSAPNAKSKWSKFDIDGNPITIYNNLNITYNLNVTPQDKDATYEAGLRKNYHITQNKLTEFDGTIAVSSFNIVEQNSTQISTPSQEIINGKLYKFAGWTDGNTSTSRNITPTDNTTYSALYKYPKHSNNQNAYSNNSQRKFTRTGDGQLHNVFESMGYVWYEKSTDNGSTWIIANGGKPLSFNESKLPSIDILNNTNNIVGIVYQEKYGNSYKIKFAWFDSYGTAYNNIVVEDEPGGFLSDSYSFNAMPVFAWGNTNEFLIVWREENDPGLHYRLGVVYQFPGGVTWHMNDAVLLNGTDETSTNPTLVTRKNTGTLKFHLAFQKEDTHIKYCSFTVDASHNISISTIESPSYGNGFNKNIKPSIALFATTQDVVIVWIVVEPITYIQKAQLKIKYVYGWSQFWTYFYSGGDNIASANINSNSQGKFVFSWGGDQVDKYITSSSATNIYNLSTQGDVQVSNAGTTMGDMKIMSFDRISSPHDFTPNAVTQGLYKGNNNEIVSKGFILTNNKDVYAFDFGAIEADGKRILFNDSFEVPDTSSENNKVETESFYLSDKSDFNFKIDYFSSVQQTNAADVNFKLQLVEANTGEFLSLLKEANPDSIGINTSYNDLGFTVNLNGLGNKEVKLRLIFEGDDFNSEIYTKTVSDSTALKKENYQQISYNGEQIVKEYGLSQNYPNPFNPSTIINYQIPHDGFVTLKIYDILGKEIKTLVNESKAIGRYEIKFDAAELASGMYIYQLKVNDFVSSKKLILMK